MTKAAGWDLRRSKSPHVDAADGAVREKRECGEGELAYFHYRYRIYKCALMFDGL